MTDFVLRAAQPTDAGKAGAILSEFADQTRWMPRVHTGAQDISFVGSMIDRGWVTVALNGPAVVGFIARENNEIHALYISQTAWRQGCGTALLRDAQKVCKKLLLWTFQGNTNAQAFYLSHGFKEAERTDGSGNDEHLPDIRFKWQKESV